MGSTDVDKISTAPESLGDSGVVYSGQVLRLLLLMTIRLYTTPTCPYCRLVKDFLKEKSLAFEEIDVTSDHHAVQEMVKLSGQMGVPVVDIDSKIIVGWNKAALEETINARLKKKAGANQPMAMAA